MDNTPLDKLLQEKDETIKLIRSLYQRLKEINDKIKINCTEHKWIDDGTFDVQNNNDHWVCSICNIYKR